MLDTERRGEERMLLEKQVEEWVRVALFSTRFKDDATTLAN
jgi:hypothetical protein